MSTGGKCVSTREPSMPSQVNVWCGIRSVSFQDSFCDRNQRDPADRTICGSAPE